MIDKFKKWFLVLIAVLALAAIWSVQKRDMDSVTGGGADILSSSEQAPAERGESLTASATPETAAARSEPSPSAPGNTREPDPALPEARYVQNSPHELLSPLAHLWGELKNRTGGTWSRMRKVGPDACG